MVFTTINRREPAGFVYANVPSSKRSRRIGAIVSSLAIALLLFDTVSKLMGGPQPMAKGLLLLVFGALYVLPRTAVLGAILLTGYLGAAVAANLSFPVFIAALVWGGLLLREERLRALLPLRR